MSRHTQSGAKRLPRWRRLGLALPLVALAACMDEPMRPAVPGDSGGKDGGTRTLPRVLGLVEVTISGIGTNQMTSTAVSARSVEELERLRALREVGVGGNAGGSSPAAGPNARHAFTRPANGDGSGDGTIQLELLSTGSLTHGERGKDGYRYLYATYRVRNAQQDGTPYDTPRKNLTLVAVKSSAPNKSIGHTPVSRLHRFDGSHADSAIARQLIPTGAVMQSRAGAIEPRFPDVLQVLTEEEAEEILDLATAAELDIDDVFPYGFVVANAARDDTRELEANPAEGQFDGIVTFAYKVPLQANPADDPFTVSILFLAVDDSETKITQSPEEQTPEGQAAFEARAASLGAIAVTLLPGGGYDGGIASRLVCSARVAGPVGAPTAVLQGTRSTRFLGFAVTPGPTPRSYSFAATFDGPATGFDSSRFIVRGLQSGVRFTGEAYTGDGTTTVSTPVGTFHAGEVVELVLKAGACVEGLPYVARHRLPAAVASGQFDPSGRMLGYTAERGAKYITIADWNGDGELDFGVTNLIDLSFISWTRRNYRFELRLAPDPKDYEYWSMRAIPGDVNGDGRIDIIVANHKNKKVQVFFGSGDGRFSAGPEMTVEGNNAFFAVAVGELNGDGVLDFVAYEAEGKRFLVGLGNGDGTFQFPYATYGVSGDVRPFFNDIDLADLNGDGRLDVVMTGSAAVHIRLGNGDGTFGDLRTLGGLIRSQEIAIADFTGDGILDIAVVDNTASAGLVVIFRGVGDGTFTRHQTVTMPEAREHESITAGDIDGDGDIDLATATMSNGGNVLILTNDGGNFAMTQRLSIPRTVGVEFGDLDGDGKVDLFVAFDPMTTPSPITIYFGQ